MIYNEILEGGLNSALTKRLGMQTASPSPALVPEIAPGLTLESDRPEWGFLKGEIRYAQSADVTSGVGLFPTIQLINPFRSGVLAVIEQIIVSDNAFLFIETTTLAGITTANGRALDSRAATASTCVLTTNSRAFPGAILRLSANIVYNFPVILASVQQGPAVNGAVAGVVGVTTNSNLRLSCVWRERPALLSELV